MRSNETLDCFTRVIVDGGATLELANLQVVIQRIRDSLPHIPDAHLTDLEHALLDLAVARGYRSGFKVGDSWRRKR
jgi:hypothetical protein